MKKETIDNWNLINEKYLETSLNEEIQDALLNIQKEGGSTTLLPDSKPISLKRAAWKQNYKIWLVFLGIWALVFISGGIYKEFFIPSIKDDNQNLVEPKSTLSDNNSQTSINQNNTSITPPLGLVKTKEEDSSLNLRATPSIKSKVITQIPNKSTVTILGYSEHTDEIDEKKGKWIHVKYNQFEGWAWEKFIVNNTNESLSSSASITNTINNLFKAWANLDLNLYMAQWDSNAEQYSKKFSPRNYQDILKRRRSLFSQLKSVEVLDYGIHNIKMESSDRASFNVNYSMIFIFNNGKKITESNIIEKYVLKYDNLKNQWVILKNYDYID